MPNLKPKNIFEWVLSLDSERATLFFSHFSRELTISFRTYDAEENLENPRKIKGMKSINEIQHRILIRLLPSGVIDREKVEIIFDEIKNQTGKDDILDSHIGAALNSARRRMDR